MQSAIGTTASGCGSDSDTSMQIRPSLQGAQLCIPSDCESRLIAHPICASCLHQCIMRYGWGRLKPEGGQIHFGLLSAKWSLVISHDADRHASHPSLLHGALLLRLGPFDSHPWPSQHPLGLLIYSRKTASPRFPKYCGPHVVSLGPMGKLRVACYLGKGEQLLTPFATISVECCLAFCYVCSKKCGFYC